MTLAETTTVATQATNPSQGPSQNCTRAMRTRTIPQARKCFCDGCSLAVSLQSCGKQHPIANHFHADLVCESTLTCDAQEPMIAQLTYRFTQNTLRARMRSLHLDFLRTL